MCRVCVFVVFLTFPRDSNDVIGSHSLVVTELDLGVKQPHDKSLSALPCLH